MRRHFRSPPLALAAALLLWAAWAAIPPEKTLPAAPLTPLEPDLNRAPLRELVLLPGVGPTRAAAIVMSRAEEGAFATLVDLERVRGIGPKTVKGLRGIARVREAGP